MKISHIVEVKLRLVGVSSGFSLKANFFSNVWFNLALLSLMKLVSPHVFVVDLCRKEPAHPAHPTWYGQFLLTLIEMCGQEIHRADQVQGQVSESWRMYKHGKTKIMETCREQTECKRWHQSEEIWSDNEIWFAAKLNGNVYEIMENVVVGFAEYSKKISQHTVEVPKSRSIRFYMIYYIVVSGQKCSQLYVFFCFCTVW